MTISLFAGIAPDQLDNTDSHIYTMGTRFFSDVPGVVDAVSYWKGSNSGTWDNRIVQVGIWDATTLTLLGSGSREQTPTDVQGPILVPLSAPVHIDAGVDYVVGYLNPATGHYVDTANFFATQHDSGVLHAYANAVKANGVLHDGNALTFPEASSNGINWFADVSFTADGPATATFAGAPLAMPVAEDPGTWTGTQQVVWASAPLAVSMPSASTQRQQTYELSVPGLSMPIELAAGAFTTGPAGEQDLAVLAAIGPVRAAGPTGPVATRRMAPAGPLRGITADGPYRGTTGKGPGV